jgi:hypothetical protein
VAFVSVHLSMRVEENVQTVKVRKDTKQFGRRIIQIKGILHNHSTNKDKPKLTSFWNFKGTVS